MTTTATQGSIAARYSGSGIYLLAKQGHVCLAAQDALGARLEALVDRGESGTTEFRRVCIELDRVGACRTDFAWCRATTGLAAEALAACSCGAAA